MKHQAQFLQVLLWCFLLAMTLSSKTTAQSGIILFPKNNNDSTYTRSLNSININLFGDASIISVNYERLFLVSPTFFLTGKLGLGYNEEFKLCLNFTPFPSGPCSPPEDYLTIPHHITGNFGQGGHYFEFGLGGTIISGNTNENYLIYPIVGYRIRTLNSNKVNFRIFGHIPFPQLEVFLDDILFIPIGFSLGISF